MFYNFPCVFFGKIGRNLHCTPSKKKKKTSLPGQTSFVPLHFISHWIGCFILLWLPSPILPISSNVARSPFLSSSVRIKTECFLDELINQKGFWRNSPGCSASCLAAASAIRSHGTHKKPLPVALFFYFHYLLPCVSPEPEPERSRNTLRPPLIDAVLWCEYGALRMVEGSILVRGIWTAACTPEMPD